MQARTLPLRSFRPTCHQAVSFSPLLPTNTSAYLRNIVDIYNLNAPITTGHNRTNSVGYHFLATVS